jgi:hypothetical protein
MVEMAGEVGAFLRLGIEISTRLLTIDILDAMKRAEEKMVEDLINLVRLQRILFCGCQWVQ